MKTDTLSRRLRFAPPNPLVHRLMLAEGDYAIFEAIDRHGPLPTQYLYRFALHHRHDYVRHQKRLTELYNGDKDGSYLTRPPQQFAGFEARYQHSVYDLAPKARQALAARGTAGRISPRHTEPFLHQLMAACVNAALELACQEQGLRYITRQEILTHPQCGAAKDAKNPMAVPLTGYEPRGFAPDDLFGIKYPGVGFRFFAIEIDRNTESIERKNLDKAAFGQKVAAYLRIFRGKTFTSWWGVPNLTVLTVTTNATHARNILDYIGKQDAGKFAQRFAIQVVEDFGPNWRVPREVLARLLTEPWTTIGGTKDISRP